MAIVSTTTSLRDVLGLKEMGWKSEQKISMEMIHCRGSELLQGFMTTAQLASAGCRGSSLAEILQSGRSLHQVQSLQ
jgi:hypothetical protein